MSLYNLKEVKEKISKCKQRGKKYFISYHNCGYTVRSKADSKSRFLDETAVIFVTNHKYTIFRC